jgi:VCBS repeat-containing protein
MHAEWVGKFDGKDYPVTGTSVTDSRSYKQVNANTLALTNKKDGKTVSTARIVTSADGKTRTVQITQMGSDGKKLSGTAVYDKQ